MTYTNDITTDTLFAIIFTVTIILLIILLLYFNVLSPLLKSRKYIKMEMDRSDGREYLFWKRQLKKLYMRHIPFIGRFLG